MYFSREKEILANVAKYYWILFNLGKLFENREIRESSVKLLYVEKEKKVRMLFFLFLFFFFAMRWERENFKFLYSGWGKREK